MISKTYKAKPNAHLSNADAKRIGAFFDEKFGDAPRTPNDVIRAAKPKRSPIHGDFEWDDAIAGHEHRLWQARHLLNSIEVVFTNGEEKPPTRAFHRVIIESEDDVREAAYVPARVVWENIDYSQQVIARAFQELKNWNARYEQYQDLAPATALVREALEQIAA